MIEVTEEELRVVDDKGEPILYPKALFEMLDPSLPAGWRFCEYADGEYHLEPALTGKGFYEEFFGSDGDRLAQAKAEQLLREILEVAMAGGSEEDRRLLQRDLERLLRS